METMSDRISALITLAGGRASSLLLTVLATIVGAVIP
jgi:hypothetical protein